MRRNERGFSLIEVVVTIALTTGVLLAVTAAVSNALHASANVATRIALRDDALSALADLRAATAYDAVLLTSMVGKTSTATVDPHHGATPPITMTISLERVASNGRSNVVATATATQNGSSVTEQQTLYVEAPMPGSTIDQ